MGAMSRLESLSPISRSEFLIIAGAIAVIFGLSKVSHRIGEQQVARNIGTPVNLAVSQSYSLPGSNDKVIYSGMTNDQKFLLTYEADRTYHGVPLYFSKDSGQITAGGHQFSVLKVTPEQLILKYLGREQG